jgi:hypothetical protein
VALWSDPRQHATARAILLHEVGHCSAGDHLIVGLGSPFVFLLKAWAVAFVALAAVPWAVFAFAGHETTVYLLAQVLLLLEQPATVLLLPVLGLWLAELGADRYAARAAGPAFLAAPPARRGVFEHGVLGLLSHPPTWLRRLLAGSSWPLLIAYPLALLLQLAIVVPVGAAAMLLLDYSWSDLRTSVGIGVRHMLGQDIRFWLAAALLLGLWPALAGAWARLWVGRGAGHSPSQAMVERPDAVRPSTRAHLAGAAVPALLILIALAASAVLPARFPPVAIPEPPVTVPTAAGVTPSAGPVASVVQGDGFLLVEPAVTHAVGTRTSGAVTEEQARTAIATDLTSLLFVSTPGGYAVYGAKLGELRPTMTVTAAGSTTLTLLATTGTDTLGSTTDLAATIAGTTATGTYHYRYVSRATVNGQPFVDERDYQGTFTAEVRRLAAAEIVPPPSGGTCAVSAAGAITITWTPAGGATYNVDRSIDAQPSGRARTAQPSYPDSSSEAAKAGTYLLGVGYAVHAVGPTGVRNPLALSFLAGPPLPTASATPTGVACTKTGGP